MAAEEEDHFTDALENISDDQSIFDLDEQEVPVQWSPELEIVLFHAIAKFRPVGVHKHFRMLSVQKLFNKDTGLNVTVNQLWGRLGTFYDLAALDAMADETDDDITFEARRKRSGYPFKVVSEFSLPTDEFDSIITEHRKAVSPPPPDRSITTRRTARASSPAEESTPEPHAEQETPTTAPVKRGVGRPRKTVKKEPAPQASSLEPPMRRTRAASASGASATPTPAAKRPKRH